MDTPPDLGLDDETVAFFARLFPAYQVLPEVSEALKQDDLFEPS